MWTDKVLSERYTYIRYIIMKENMKKTYQTPVITAIEIAVESQILAASSLPIRNDDEYIDYPEMMD